MLSNYFTEDAESILLSVCNFFKLFVELFRRTQASVFQKVFYQSSIQDLGLKCPTVSAKSLLRGSYLSFISFAAFFKLVEGINYFPFAYVWDKFKPKTDE